MAGKISVKGTGRLSLSPDQTDILLTLNSQDKDYPTAAGIAESRIESLKTALLPLGFSPEDLRTSGFSVRAEYEGVQDEKGIFRNVFSGYCCTHQLRLTFPMDNQKLSEVISAVSSSGAEPELSITFGIGDPESAKEELLRSAAENARKKASILAAASGASLGKLLEIRYSVSEKDFVSPAAVEMNDCLRACGSGLAKAVSFQPEDISVSDSAEFVWELE